MNQATRKILNELNDQLGQILCELEHLAEMEREKFENLPDSLQESDQGQAIEAAADTMEQAAEDLGQVWQEIEYLAE